ncbi:MAG: bifunctional hydroxymethylpyrimidine kinase/phosphomethylpyrimidine kinase, partial [Myxococcales bacterium]|nr:bifunctional hydroxymethylpyrimidine kinase/phosphomethylpyrimidine kinase [Myxococcales bacterium]
ERLLEKGARAALVKGGHLPGSEVVDALVTPEGHQLYRSPRIESRHTHGTGCTLASAVAASMAQGMPLPDAVHRAREFVRRAMEAAPGLGAGHGPLGHSRVTGI